MAECNVQSLLNSSACFGCLSPGEWDILELQLLCEILNSNPPVKLNSFTQGNVTIPNTNLASVSHGLGSRPNMFEVAMVCISTDGSFQVGDSIPVSDVISHSDTNSGGAGSMEMGSNSTHLWVSNNSALVSLASNIGGIQFAPPAGGPTQLINVSKWVFQFDALKF